MKKTISLAAGLLAVAAAVVPAAQAQSVTVQVVGVGAASSWTIAAYGAWHDLAGAGAGHYTVKGTCTSGNCAQIRDNRSASINPEGGSLWVVWNAAQTSVWAYISVDAVVGVRSFFATPRAELQIDAQTLTLAGQNLISSSLWGADASALPSAIYTALNNHAFTAAFTGIRPEDAKFATTRVMSALNTTTYAGLGYGTGPGTLIGTQIKSAFSSTVANPVDFNLSGTDPFTSQPVKSFKVLDIGAIPMIFIANRTNTSGLGAKNLAGSPIFKNLKSGTATSSATVLFNGTECDGAAFKAAGAPANFPVTVVTREPTSGAMNVVEFSVFRTSSQPNNSQEKGVNPANVGNNPLNTSCATVGGVTGTRKRAIQDSEMVSKGILPEKDALGYINWSFGNVAPIAGSASYGYLTLNSVDPINASYSTGTLPTCTAPCPSTPGSSFPNLRNGTYKLWTVLTVITDVSGANLTAANNLVAALQADVDSTVPDFVPFTAQGSDPGLKYYHSHYLQSGVSPNNGLGGQTEAGGDMGGCVEPVGPPPGILNCHL